MREAFGHLEVDADDFVDRIDPESNAASSGVPQCPEYHNTLVMRSSNPFDFGTYGGDDANEIVTRLPLHAPEYVCDPATNQWYVTSAGWPGDFFRPVGPGGVAVTELEWVED